MKFRDFECLQGDTFSLKQEGEEISFDLVEVTRQGRGDRDGGAFSLLWEAPTQPPLPQSIYAFSHKDLGEFEIFIVPVAQFGDIVQYEALFT